MFVEVEPEAEVLVVVEEELFVSFFNSLCDFFRKIVDCFKWALFGESKFRIHKEKP